MRWTMTSTVALVGLLLSGSTQAQRPRPKITGVSHLSVYTADSAASEHFYVYDLGAMKAPDPQTAAGTRYYFNAEQFVEVLPLETGATPNSRFDHAGFNTDDAEALRQYLGEHHVDVPASVKAAADGSRYFEVKDPEGNRVQFVQPPAHPLDVPKNALSSHIIHVGYVVHNPALEDGFYKDLLGFHAYWHGGMKDDVTQWISLQVPDGHDWVEYMVTPGPERTGVPPSMSRDTAGVLNHFALGVHNVEKTMNLLYEGQRLDEKHGPPQIGRDGKWQLNLFDPDGTRAEIMEFQPSVKPCCSPFMAASPID